MREILFRGKRSYDKKWMFGNLVIDNEGEKHILPFNWIEQCGYHLRIYSDEPLFFEQETVGQLCELTDKNGTNIFEGDIVKTKFYKHAEKTLELIQYIEFRDGCFFVKTKDADKKDYDFTYKYIELFGISEIEVIGNIYDNPELL